MKYDYDYISSEVRRFENLNVIGKTSLKRNIYCFSIGEGEKSAVFAAAFHGLEYLTGAALIDFAKRYVNMDKYHNKIKIYFIPMINPDGVDIAINGIDPKNLIHRYIIKNTGILNFTENWQSNAMGVDINHNFNADWRSIKSEPSFSKYGGPFPESEPETRALSKFLIKVKPELFIAFHSQGKEIYYDFNGMENKDAERQAEAVAGLCGYKAAKPTGTASFGGAKDWYIQEYHKAAFTVELGEGKNPLPHSQLGEMKEDLFKICIGFINIILQ